MYRQNSDDSRLNFLVMDRVVGLGPAELETVGDDRSFMPVNGSV